MAMHMYMRVIILGLSRMGKGTLDNTITRTCLTSLTSTGTYKHADCILNIYKYIQTCRVWFFGHALLLLRSPIVSIFAFLRLTT